VSPTAELRIARQVFVAAVALSTVHYIDNTVRFDDYTGGKSGLITRPMVPISWVLFTAAGIAGLVYLRRGRRAKAGPLLGVYSVSGLIGLAHFTTVSPSDFDWFQNTFIALDFLAGAAVLILAVRITLGSGRGERRVSPPPTSSDRSPAESASR
jgi:hypothetical protein